MKMASGQDNNTVEQRIIQCLVLMIKEQSALKEVLNKFTAEMGQFRENMYQEFERLQDSVNSINRKLTSSKKCVCGGDTAAGTQHGQGTKSKRPRRPARTSPDNSDDDADPNINRGRPKKRTDKTGLDSLGVGRNDPESPVQMKTDPPRNVQKPVPTSKSVMNGNAALYNMTKAQLPNKALLKPKPQEADFIQLMKKLKVEVNPATIAAVSSAVQKKGTALDSRPPALHTVIILDISESMNGKPFDTAKSFVNKVIDGIDASAGGYGLEEYISVITCGHSTGIAQPFTNDYVQVRNTLDQLATGGRTPLMTSLTLALCYLELQSECVQIGSHVIMPRVVIVSDFDATIDTQFKGRDADNSEDRIKVQRELFNLGLTYKSRGYGVFCVPIGESNRPVADGFISKSNGEIVKHKAAQSVGNYYRYQVTIGRAFVDYDQGVSNDQDLDIYILVQNTMPQTGLDKKQQKGVIALLEKILQRDDDIDDSEDDEGTTDSQVRNDKDTKKVENHFDNDHDDDHDEENTGEDDDDDDDDDDEPPDLPEWVPTRNVDSIGFQEESGLPSIGSRVMKGKDWHFNDEGGNGPGTVVGHKQRGIAFILWDNGQIGAYRYNHSGKYDVKTCKEPRRVTSGNIEVGCCVKRGADWNRGDEDGGSGTVGVVVRKLSDRYVMVRWPSRVIETYKFGADNKWDLEVTQDLPHTAGNDVLEDSGAGAPVDSLENTYSPGVEDLKPWWSWMDGHGQWRPFSEQSVAKLEHKKSSGLAQQQCLVDYENKPVKVFLSQNICEIGGVQYHVKREMMKAEEIESMKMLEQYLQPIN